MRNLMHIHSAPVQALHVIGVLESAGFEAWIVGGWVRDALLGMSVHDVDIATDAPWQASMHVLAEAGCVVTKSGTAHGTITATYQNMEIEVTTYRVEGSYSDHRHPDEVRFVTDICEDLARRDFTINAMAWHPQRGILDPFGGVQDARLGTIRTVGNPHKRFEEDALRMIRAVRFSVCMGFAVERNTQEALDHLVDDVRLVASERVGNELQRIVMAGKAGRALLEQPLAMCAIIPELKETYGFDQRSVYHVYDVYEHTAHVCNAVEAFTAGCAAPALRWAALLHDVAKPATYSEDIAGHGHFFCHPREGARMAQAILSRMGVACDVIAPACALISMHDEPMPPTEEAIRRLLAYFMKCCPGREVPLAFSLLDLRRADAVSKCASAAVFAVELDRYSKILREEVRRGPIYDVRHLAVSGKDIIRICNVKPGPAVGMQLEMLLQAVLRGELENDREELLSWLS